MQVGGLSNIGLDVMSDLGVAQCARALSNLRDVLSDAGPDVIKKTAKSFPYQSTLDNCDMQAKHLTIEVIEKGNYRHFHLKH